MDRDKRWDRLEAVYNMLTDDYPEYIADSAIEVLEDSYNYTDSDEFVLPTKFLQ